MRFDTSKQTPLMLACFASIGLNAKLSSLKVRGGGGAMLLRFVLVVLGRLILQDALGIGLAKALVPAGGVIGPPEGRRNEVWLEVHSRCDSQTNSGDSQTLAIS
ncbi:sodium/glutamate symporter [Ralstonia pseudosolanacearum]|uniref:sodium/glutamate symporter n=1 Tax=Ralstonia pseudosolanacearum TaxID=1310165 RepID=UPI003CEA8A01